MCGRFALSIQTKDIEKLKPGFGVAESEPPRYNIAPSAPIAATKNDSSFELTYLRWGLLPSWAKPGTTIAPMINARSETILEKPTFRNLLRKRRALVFASAYYEWKKIPGIKQKFPFAIHLPNMEPFTFAAIWDRNFEINEALLESCAIITAPASMPIEHIHPRMPLIIAPEHRELWLSDEPLPDEILLEMLAGEPNQILQAYEVSSRVNHVGDDSPECLQPANPFAEPPSTNEPLF